MAPTPLTPTTPNSSARKPYLLVGDSVILGSVPSLRKAGMNIADVNAVVGSQVKPRIAALQELKNQNRIPANVIVHLGNNGLFTSAQFDQIMSILSGCESVSFLTDKMPNKPEDQRVQSHNNEVIRNGVQKYKNAHLIDWFEYSHNNSGWFCPDGVHPNNNGAKIYAQFVMDNLSRIPTAPLVATTQPKPDPASAQPLPAGYTPGAGLQQLANLDTNFVNNTNQTIGSSGAYVRKVTGKSSGKNFRPHKEHRSKSVSADVRVKSNEKKSALWGKVKSESYISVKPDPKKFIGPGLPVDFKESSKHGKQPGRAAVPARTNNKTPVPHAAKAPVAHSKPTPAVHHPTPHH